MRYLPTAELTPEDTVILFLVSGSSGGVGRQMSVEAAERLSTVGERERGLGERGDS